MTDETPRPKRRMKQPTKAELRRRLAEAEERAARAHDGWIESAQAFGEISIRQHAKIMIERERVDGMRAARQHDHDIARRVPRWVRRIFRA